MIEIAYNLLSQDINIDAISSATGLSIAEIESLQNGTGKDKS